MSDAHAGDVVRDESSRGFGTADWLGLAAAPTFAGMAVLTGILGGDMICSATQDVSPLSGMVPMYVLMSAFHSAPWLKLISNLRSDGRRA